MVVPPLDKDDVLAPLPHHVVHRVPARLPDLKIVCVWPFGLDRAMAPLRYAAKFDPFLSLDRAPTPSTLAQRK